MSKLLLDLGNTRIKASVYKNQKIQARKSFDYENLTIFFEYIEQLTKNYYEAVISNVKEKKYLKMVLNFLEKKKITFRVIEPKISSCGLSNRYNNPKELGSDRWCAAIGAFSLKRNSNIMIVHLGTTIVIDIVDENGYFQGGSIAPGYKLLLNSLKIGTNNLNDIHDGQYEFPAKGTKNSVFTGIINSIYGQINISYEILKKMQNSKVEVILTGGDAYKIKEQFNPDFSIIEDLIFLGMLEIEKEVKLRE
tara:strand:+ start:22 stop:771 length:750 start_codon:yes stop_codon:yes gene_type:complete